MAKSNTKTKNTKGGKSRKSSSKNTETARRTRRTEEEKRAEIREAMEKKRSHTFLMDTIWGIVLIVTGIFLFISIQFKTTGEVGTVIGTALKGCLGLIAYILPWYLVLLGALLVAHRALHVSKRTAIVSVVLVVLLCFLNSGRYIRPAASITANFGKFYTGGTVLKNGGFIGMTLGTLLAKAIGMPGLYLFTAAGILICLMLLLNTPISRWAEQRRQQHEEQNMMDEMNRIEDAKEAAVDRAKQKHEELEEWRASLARKREAERLPAPSGSNPASNAFEIARVNDPEGSAGAEQNTKKPGAEGSATSDGAGTRRSFGIEAIRRVKKGFGLDGEDPEAPGTSETMRADGTGDAVSGAGAGNGTTPPNGDPDAQEAAPKKRAVLTKKDQHDTEEAIAAGLARSLSHYKKPPVDLLEPPESAVDPDRDDELRKKAELLEETLQSFHVDAHVVDVARGPAATRYEIQPGTGVKVSSIVHLADDIALNLRAKSIRMEAPIPGKAAVGIEVENDHIQMVRIREIIDSPAFRSEKSKIAFAVGRDISGRPVVADLKTMPHLLIAGSTGSGKSVCINSIIASILYKADPNEVKLVLIDPKVVELGNYNGIPHLLIPVVTDPAKAAAALQWAVSEMTDRYKALADNNVRDLKSYNRKMEKIGEPDRKIPQIVIIIDELADLMMAAPSQVEESIARLAALARAAGMHLIVATQRPSVDVITGLIKANIPSRISFAVSSQFDSRTILDMNGAEKLVGKGDMLFYPLGAAKPQRVQGTFISDEEVNRLIDYVKQQAEAEYSEEVAQTIENGGPDKGLLDSSSDALLPEAVKFVVEKGSASTSMIQRQFRIGYNRAARIMDELESRGIVGPQDGSRPRQVLMTEVELAAEIDRANGIEPEDGPDDVPDDEAPETVEEVAAEDEENTGASEDAPFTPDNPVGTAGPSPILDPDEGEPLHFTSQDPTPLPWEDEDRSPYEGTSAADDFLGLRDDD